ncbi:hypothetical protein GEMRC1_011278 [Eukaryota sp. GEM-RC1]
MIPFTQSFTQSFRKQVLSRVLQFKLTASSQCHWHFIPTFSTVILLRILISLLCFRFLWGSGVGPKKHLDNTVIFHAYSWSLVITLSLYVSFFFIVFLCLAALQKRYAHNSFLAKKKEPLKLPSSRSTHVSTRTTQTSTIIDTSDLTTSQQLECDIISNLTGAFQPRNASSGQLSDQSSSSPSSSPTPSFALPPFPDTCSSPLTPDASPPGVSTLNEHPNVFSSSSRSNSETEEPDIQNQLHRVLSEYTTPSYLKRLSSKVDSVEKVRKLQRQLDEFLESV